MHTVKAAFFTIALVGLSMLAGVAAADTTVFGPPAPAAAPMPISAVPGAALSAASDNASEMARKAVGAEHHALDQQIEKQHTLARMPMAKQIAKNLNNDGEEAFTNTRSNRPLKRNAFGRVVDRQASSRAIYNRNDDSIIQQNPRGPRVFHHRAFTRPAFNGTPIANTYNN